MSDSKQDIQVFNQTDYSIPIDDSLYSKIAISVAEQEQCGYNFLEIVYVDENEIVRINKEYLDRDYVTDIITFRYDDADTPSEIEGTLFCCAPRIVEQAEEFNESTDREFLRIIIHGLLHLIGYDDKTEEEKKEMTARENAYLDSVASL